jgi:hypothetical protein
MRRFEPPRSSIDLGKRRVKSLQGPTAPLFPFGILHFYAVLIAQITSMGSVK